MTATMTLVHSYAEALEGLYAPWQGEAWPAPEMVLFNAPLAEALGLGAVGLERDAAFLTGAQLPAGARPLAQAYAGHQFGGFSPQLGDGRALLLGEIVTPSGALVDLHLKGSGRTPFSRGGDGRAVLGPVLREYLISEAMAALGVPTSRALAACTTGERVLRQFGPEQGAVLARTAASHLRIGTFQFFAARGEGEKLRRLLDYAVARHDPDLAGREDMALAFLRRVAERQVRLVAGWMGLGFVHGVMNTDNVTISGETIDYGPCAFMDRYDPATVFSSIDQQGRYAYGNQPAIILWNLARLAEALLGLIAREEDVAIARASEVIEAARREYESAWCAVFARKLGLTRVEVGLVDEMHALWEGQGVDFTQFFRALPQALSGDPGPLRALFATLDAALERWLAQLAALEPDMAAMDAHNPVYIPRNHLVEEALDAARESGDLTLFHALLAHVQAPFTPREGSERYAAPPAPDAASVVTFCGT